MLSRRCREAPISETVAPDPSDSSACLRRARSSADARGLMQIMPFTGKDLARNLRIKDYTLDRLFEPLLNIRFGMSYLSWYLKKFEGVKEHTLAAYNGGPTNVRRWLGRQTTDDLDVFIEDIVYSETRKYVKLVMKNYRLYYELWGDVCLTSTE